MFGKLSRRQTYLEIMLILIALSTACLFYKMHGYKMVVLYLFYLPVVLSGFFLGRYHAGLLAVFCVMAASLMGVLDWTGFAAYTSPMIIGLTISIWASTLGLIALLVGTLSDDRITKIKELKQAYMRVAEVLSRYLQSANPRLKARSIRVAELGQVVAAKMNLSPKQIDDIRVASLLYDIGKVEITTKLIKKAVSTLQENPEQTVEESFRGTELLNSLSAALSPDILPLLDPDNVASEDPSRQDELVAAIPVGARVIHMVRAYDDLTEGAVTGMALAPHEAIRELRGDKPAQVDQEILTALERSIGQDAESLTEQFLYST